MPSPDKLFASAALALQKGDPRSASAPLKKLRKQFPGHPDVLHLWGLYLKDTGRLGEAVTALRKSLKVGAESVELLTNLANVLIELGELEDAEESLRRVVRIAPNLAEARNALGHVFLRRKRFSEAEEEFQTALRLLPGMPQAQLGLGEAVAGLRDYASAEQVLLDARVRWKGDDTEVLGLLAKLYEEWGRPRAAANCFRELLVRDDANEWAILGLARSLDAFGDYAEATALIDKALVLNPESYSAMAEKADKLSAQNDRSGAWESNRAIVAKHPCNSRAVVGLALAASAESEEADAVILAAIKRARKCRDREGADELRLALAESAVAHRGKRFEESMSLALAGHAVMARESSYVAEQYEKIISDFAAGFDPNGGIKANESRARTDLPVLVVGMPRSGTTLIEQILAAHPDVYGVGERIALDEVVRGIKRSSPNDNPYQAVAAMSPNERADWAAIYPARLLEHAPHADRIVDKMPFNFWHLGYVDLLLPDAYVVHSQRHPLDTCASILTQNFDNDFSFSHTLERLAHYYRSYWEMMSAYRSLSRRKLLEMPYELMVAAQEASSRKLIEFCDLPWSEQCLRFHEMERKVTTASQAQVRQRIYTDSVSRWKRYQTQLEPLREMLSDIVEEYEAMVQERLEAIRE